MNTLITNDDSNILLAALEKEYNKDKVELLPGDLTRKMIAKQLKRSTNGVRDWMEKQIELGYFIRLPNSKTAFYRLTDEGRKKFNIGSEK
jgi:hypothetical protein